MQIIFLMKTAVEFLLSKASGRINIQMLVAHLFLFVFIHITMVHVIISLLNVLLYYRFILIIK